MGNEFLQTQHNPHKTKRKGPMCARESGTLVVKKCWHRDCSVVPSQKSSKAANTDCVVSNFEVTPSIPVSRDVRDFKTSV